MYMSQGYISVLYIIFHCYLVAGRWKPPGSPCKWSGGTGICSLVQNCTQALESLAKTHSTGLESCGFVGVDQVVCCPMDKASDSDILVVTRRKSEEVCEKISLDAESAIVPHILGGTEADKSEFPHMAALGFEETTGDISFNCGASLISKSYILTAAHCLKDRRPLRIVRMRTNILNGSEAKDFSIKKVIPHPQYNMLSKHNDIALIELNERVVFESDLYPACLNFGNMSGDLIVTGWGLNATSGLGYMSNTLQKATVQTTPQAKCNEDYSSLNQGTIMDTQICAGSRLADSCREDINIWMHYVGENWTKAIDLHTAIERLGEELSCLSFDRLHDMNYDMNYCFFEEKVILQKECDKFDNSSVLCSKYRAGDINLEQYCGEIVKLELKSFLIYNLLDYLPKPIIEKYNLMRKDLCDAKMRVRSTTSQCNTFGL